MELTNKKIAIFGIATFILSVITSAEDLEGNSVAPVALILISGIATIAFTIMATIRLWKEAMYVSVMLVISTITLFILETNQEASLIVLLNVARVTQFIIFVWAVIKLYKSKVHGNNQETY